MNPSKYFVVRSSDMFLMHASAELTFIQNGQEILGLRARDVSRSETLECVVQTGPDQGAMFADLLKIAGAENQAHDLELRKKRSISEIYESEGIVSEALYEILHAAAPDVVFGAKVLLTHQNENKKYDYRFLLIKDAISSAGRDEVPGVYFWGAVSFKPEQVKGKQVFLLPKMTEALEEHEFQDLNLKLLCVDEEIAMKIKAANLAGVQLSEFRIESN